MIYYSHIIGILSGEVLSLLQLKRNDFEKQLKDHWFGYSPSVQSKLVLHASPGMLSISGEIVSLMSNTDKKRLKLGISF